MEDEEKVCLLLKKNSETGKREAQLVRRTEEEFKALVGRKDCVIIAYSFIPVGGVARRRLNMGESNRTLCNLLQFKSTRGEVFICAAISDGNRNKVKYVAGPNGWQRHINRINAQTEYVFKYVNGSFSSIGKNEEFLQYMHWRCARSLFAEKDPFRPKEVDNNNNDNEDNDNEDRDNNEDNEDNDNEDNDNEDPE